MVGTVIIIARTVDNANSFAGIFLQVWSHDSRLIASTLYTENEVQLLLYSFEESSSLEWSYYYVIPNFSILSRCRRIFSL